MRKTRKITHPDTLERIRRERKAAQEATSRRVLRDAVGDFNEFLHGCRNMQHTRNHGWIPADERNYP